MTDLIAIYLVTFRRNEMLKRALRSVLGQTHRNIVVRVVNDDPADAKVEKIVRDANDPRVALFTPVEKRGGTRNFNLVFQERQANYVALLEDDNWWEPTFLEAMLALLAQHPEAPLAVGNELIWKEQPDSSWLNTRRTIWDFDDVRPHRYSLESLCGHAKICNSSMLFRLPEANRFLTPDTIPVDVTEHFRERLFPSTILLNGAPLVNFAVTLSTARDEGPIWTQYQYILIGSAFAALDRAEKRRKLARALWAECPEPTSPRAVSLVATGLAIKQARALVSQAPLASLMRAGVWMARKPQRLAVLARTQRALSDELQFLAKAPLTQSLAASF